MSWWMRVGRMPRCTSEMNSARTRRTSLTSSLMPSSLSRLRFAEFIRSPSPGGAVLRLGGLEVGGKLAGAGMLRECDGVVTGRSPRVWPPLPPSFPSRPRGRIRAPQSPMRFFSSAMRA